MIQEEEILSIASYTSKVLHKRLDKNRYQGEKMPEPNPLYDESVDMWQRMRIHTSSEFPHKLFSNKAPNETQAEFDYRKLNYRNNTKQDMGRALHMVNRIWNTQNYSLTFNEDDSFFGDDTMSKYVLKDYPRGKSILDYFSSVVTKNKDIDPNGVLCLKPLPLFELDNDGKPVEGVFDDRELVEPVVYLYHSDKVMDFVPNTYTMILTGRKSTVKIGTTKSNTGLVFEFYDDTAIYEVRQIGEKTDNTFEVVLYYEHNLGYMPCYKLAGIPIGRDDNDGYQLYKSPFFDAVDLLDGALYDKSTLDVSKVSHAYLQKWEYVNECNECLGKGEMMYGDINEFVTCKSCKGTGVKSKLGPMKSYEIKTPDSVVDNGDLISPPPAGFIEKDSKILDFLDDQIKKQKKEAFAMVNIEFTSEATGKETATARHIDREEMFSFLLVEAMQNFRLLDSMLWAIGFMRYGDRYNGHTLTVPNQFAISSANDLTFEISKARESNLPGIALAGLTEQYMKSRFSSLNIDADRAFDVVNYTDSLMYLTAIEITSALNQGAAAKWQATLHNNIQAYLAQEIDADADFLDKDLSEIKTILDNKAKAEQSQINPQATGEQIIDSIVNANTITT